MVLSDSRRHFNSSFSCHEAYNLLWNYLENITLCYILFECTAQFTEWVNHIVHILQVTIAHNRKLFSCECQRGFISSYFYQNEMFILFFLCATGTKQMGYVVSLIRRFKSSD